jgi:hypothetical protein
MSDLSPEPTTVELAQAIDASLDAVDQALDAGDIPTAQALVTAAGETSDSLLAALGAPEAE